MRKGIILLLFQAIFFSSLFAQNYWGELGLSCSVLNSHKQLQSAYIQSDEGILGRGFLSFSADYWYLLSDNYYLESGLNISNHSFAKYPFSTPESQTFYDEQLINIPLGIRKSFWKYYFVNTGILFDLNNKSGIGSYFGAGVKFDSEMGFSLFINPYTKIHSIVSFGSHRNKNQILESGVKIGVSYPLRKLIRGRGRGF